jgi:hypothetical protein
MRPIIQQFCNFFLSDFATLKGRGPQTDKHLLAKKVPLQVNFLYDKHFALISIESISP